MNDLRFPVIPCTSMEIIRLFVNMIADGLKGHERPFSVDHQSRHFIVNAVQIDWCKVPRGIFVEINHAGLLLLLILWCKLLFLYLLLLINSGRIIAVYQIPIRIEIIDYYMFRSFSIENSIQFSIHIKAECSKRIRR